jgi:hypothetical protein
MVGNMRFDRVKIGKIISDIQKYQRDLEELKIANANNFFNCKCCSRFRK